MNTTENNKLIAEFMEVNDHEIEMERCYTNNMWSPFYRYNTEWNWLMPVVEKINNSFVEYEHNDKGIVNGLVKGKDGEWVDDRIKRIHNAVLQFNIDIIYQAVVEFIKWHNLNK